jgi:GT2 family glycosyltransferase
MNILRDVLAQTYRPLEILIIDQSREVSQSLKSLVAAHPDMMHYYPRPPLGVAGARNVAWQLAKYELIVFVDDDTRCGPDLVSEHVRALCLPGVGLVAGAIDEFKKSKDCVHTGKFSFWTATPHRGFGNRGLMDVDHAGGGNFSTRRSILAASGGLDERLSIGAGLYEETEFSLRIKRAGYRIVFNGQARLLHLAASTGGCRMRDLEKYIWGLGHNRAILIRRHLRWFHRPTALLRLSALAGAYAWSYRKPGLLLTCARAFLVGWQIGTAVPFCSRNTTSL